MAANELYLTTLYTDANLQHYYRLEDANDNKGSNNLDNNGTVPFNAALFGNGANYGASNSTKSLTRSDNNGIANSSFTIMGWIKFATLPAEGNVQLPFSAVNNTDKVEFRSYVITTGGVQYLIVGKLTNGITNDNFTSASAITTGTSNFHHFAYTWNGTTLRGYWDGSEVINGNPNTGSGNSATNTAFGLGVEALSYPTLSGWISGILDDWAIFNRVLSATEISDYYNGNTPLRSGIKSQAFNHGWSWPI